MKSEAPLLLRPPTPGPADTTGCPLVEAPPAQRPSWGEMVEVAERIIDPMETSQEHPKEGTPYQPQAKAPSTTTGISLVGVPSGQKASYSEATTRGSVASG